VVSVVFPLVTLLGWVGLAVYVVLAAMLGSIEDAVLFGVLGAIPLLLWSILVAFLVYNAGFRRVCRLTLEPDGSLQWQAAFRSGRFHVNDLQAVDGSTGPFRPMMRFRHAGGEISCYATLPGLERLVQVIRMRAPHVR